MVRQLGIATATTLLAINVYIPRVREYGGSTMATQLLALRSSLQT